MIDQIERVRRCNEITERAVPVVIVVADEKCVQCARDVYASDGVRYNGLVMHIACVEAFIGLLTAQRDYAMQQTLQAPTWPQQWTSWGASGGGTASLSLYYDVTTATSASAAPTFPTYSTVPTYATNIKYTLTPSTLLLPKRDSGP